MPNYENGKIYKIVDHTNNNIYIGSTCEPTLARRLAGHKTKYNHFIKGHKKSFMSSYSIIHNNNYEIILIENYPCKTKDELHSREAYYIENSQNVINHQKPNGYNKYENAAAYSKQYDIDHRDHKMEQIICECGGHYVRMRKKRHERSKKHQKFINELK